jgi:hypothetical protein
VSVSPGSIVALGSITIEVGGTAEVLTVKAEAPLVQTASGERSFTVSTESVSNLPLANRTFDSLLSLAPGVVVTPGALDPAARVGGGGGSNYMLDGATAMDPGINRSGHAHQRRVARRGEGRARRVIRPSTPVRQACRSTRSPRAGPNQFRGSLYEVFRNSDWNATRKTNFSTAIPSRSSDQKDYGFSVGGPGRQRPAAENKLFLLLQLEIQSAHLRRRREPLPRADAARAAGDFSQSRDNNGKPVSLHQGSADCRDVSAADTRACFQDGGVLGRIPANRLYQTGLNILKWWPAPNIAQPAGQAYNFESVDPAVHLLGYQPVIRLDYQPTPNFAAASSSSSTSSRPR